MVLPTVYQGCYNAITRSIEFEATAAFRELGIRTYHYNPLAGGLLSGKCEQPSLASTAHAPIADGSLRLSPVGLMADESEDDPQRAEGRFGNASPISGEVYSARYWKPKIFEGLQVCARSAASASNL